LSRAEEAPRASAVARSSGQAEKTVETVGDATTVAQLREGSKRVAEALAGALLVSRATSGLAEKLEAGGVVERPLLQIRQRGEAVGLRRA
jgi:hypothetical protein